MVTGDLLHNFHCLTGTVSLCGSTPDNGSSKHIETLNTSRSCCIRGITQRSQRYHSSVRSFHKEQVDIVFMFPIRSFRLNIYLIYTVEHIKVIHIHRTCIRFHRRKHICQRYSQHFHFVSVHIKIKLGNLRLQGRRQTGKLLTFGSIIHQRICRIYQIIESSLSTSFQLHFKTTGAAQSRYDRRSRQVDFTFGIFSQMFFYRIHNFFNTGALSLFPRFQNNGQLGTPLITPYTRAASGHVLYIFYIWILLQISNRAFRHYTCSLQGSSFRQFKFNLKVSLVFYRQETSRNNPVNQQNSNQYHTKSTQNPTRMFDSTGDGSYILIASDTQPLIDLSEYYIFLLATIRFQNERTHHRAQR